MNSYYKPYYGFNDQSNIDFYQYGKNYNNKNKGDEDELDPY